MLLGLMFYAPPNTQLAGQQSVEPGQTRGSDQKRGGFVMSATRHRRGRAPAVGEPVPARFFPGLRLKIALALRTTEVPLSSRPMPPFRDIVVVHSSDLHVDHDYTARLHGGDGTAGLSSVLSAARGAGADVVVLAGDTFDCHRLPTFLLDRVAAIISAAALPVVLLPGNHDPAVPDAVYHGGA